MQIIKESSYLSIVRTHHIHAVKEHQAPNATFTLSRKSPWFAGFLIIFLKSKSGNMMAISCSESSADTYYVDSIIYSLYFLI